MNILYHHRTQGHGAEGVHITSIINGFKKQEQWQQRLEYPFTADFIYQKIVGVFKNSIECPIGVNPEIELGKPVNPVLFEHPEITEFLPYSATAA